MNPAIDLRSPEDDRRRSGTGGVDWSLTRLRDRALDGRIVAEVRPGESVLDLGCGRGELLALLRQERGIRDAGIEISGAAVAEAISRGLAVVHGDLEEGLSHLGDRTFDVVILNQVITVIRDPVRLLQEAMRVGQRIIVTFPNFASWRNRLQLVARGLLPVTPNLPYQWYDTPNIRLITVRDFRRLCRWRGFCVTGEAYVAADGRGGFRFIRRRPNLRASSALFVLERNGPGTLNNHPGISAGSPAVTTATGPEPGGRGSNPAG